MNAEEEQYINAIKKLDGEHREVVIGILKEIKRLKEEGKDELNSEMFEKFLEFKQLIK